MPARRSEGRPSHKGTAATIPVRTSHFSEKIALELIGAIYDAAVSPSAWKTFLDKFAESMHGECTSLLWYDFRSLSGGISFSARVDPEHIKRYDEYYAGIDVWAEGCKKKKILVPQRVFLGQEFCSSRELEQSEFYADFLRPMNAYHQIIGIISKDDYAVGAISSLRPNRQRPFEEELKLANLLMPHLKRALEVHVRTLGLQDRLSASMEALERLRIGVVLVNGQGKVLLANRTARALANQDDGFALSHDGLALTRSDEAANLRRLIQGASTTSTGKGFNSGGVLCVSRPSLKRPYSILVAPHAKNHGSLSSLQPAAIIFISDPEQEEIPDELVLSKLFGFTPAEAKLAALLAQGRSLKEAADTSGVARSTVRSQLKKLFEKTNTRRQGELIRLLMNSPIIHKLDG